MPLLYEEINVLIYGMNLLNLLIFTYKCSDKKCFHIKMLSHTRPPARKHTHTAFVLKYAVEISQPTSTGSGNGSLAGA